MARHAHIWIIALVLITTGCASASQPSPGIGSVPNVETTAGLAPPTTATRDPATSTTQVVTATTQPASQTTTSTTTPSISTTEAPKPATPVPPVIATIDTGHLDALVDELSEILGDLEQSLNEEEGDIFND